MGTPETVVIVGAGLAGAKTAEALRDEGFNGRVVLIGEEAARPYDRPPLSKDYLQGRSEKEKIFVHPPGWYADHDVDLRLGTRVASIDRASHDVRFDAGGQIGYDKLLLATGASPRPLMLPGGDTHRVFMLRTLEDCEQLKAMFRSTSRIVMVGAGWIGLEVAAAARAGGVDVTVLERGPLPLLRLFGQETAMVFADLHRRHGVDLRVEAQVAELLGGDAGQATGVRLVDGSQIDADLVVAGVGATPNTCLAEAAGLRIDNGVKVDEHLRSSDTDIYAVGDVANAFHPVYGKHIRVEHWMNALNQPIVAAKSMLGHDTVYDQLPYFYSDQYELGMEYSGYVEPGGYDAVVFRGDKDSFEFVSFWLKDHQVLAGMNVNVWDETDSIRALISSGNKVNSAQLTDPQTSLTELIGPNQEKPIQQTRSL